MTTPSETPGNPYNGDDRDAGAGDHTASSLPSYSDYTANPGDPSDAGAAPQQQLVGGAYPGAGKRFGAYLIDSILLGIVGSIIVFVFAGDDLTKYADAVSAWQTAGSPGNPPTMDRGGVLIASLITLVLWFVYRVGLEVRTGQTLGKMALGIKVVDADGAKLTAVASFKRNSWYIVVFLLSISVGLIGYVVALIIFIVLGVMIARSPYGQHTFDQWAKAYVVNAR